MSRFLNIVDSEISSLITLEREVTGAREEDNVFSLFRGRRRDADPQC